MIKLLIKAFVEKPVPVPTFRNICLLMTWPFHIYTYKTLAGPGRNNILNCGPGSHSEAFFMLNLEIANSMSTHTTKKLKTILLKKLLSTV